MERHHIVLKKRLLFCYHNTWACSFLRKRTYPKHLRGILHHGTIFNFNARETDNVLFLTLSCDKVPTNKWAVPRNRFSITMIACIAKVRVVLHAKMTMLYVEKTILRSMLEIDENRKSSLPMGPLGLMHKLAKETHHISDVKTCNSQP